MERSALLKVGGFTAMLALVFAAAALAGSAIDPSVDEAEPAHEGSAEAGHTAEADAGQAPTHTEGESEVPGLAVAQDGYRLAPSDFRVMPGPSTPFSFRILGPDGKAVTDFDRTHERRLHLIAVRRDLTGFQHLHPKMGNDGTWRVALNTSTPGAYRVFADFSVEGHALTLGTDLLVPGDAVVRRLPAPARNTNLAGGYRVALTQDGSELSFDITRNGRAVKSIQPYLGADGHLVALRDHDLGFIHTHPQGEPGGSGPIRFDVEFPSEGQYRLYLQFKAAGQLRTAPFTVRIDAQDQAVHEEGEAHDGGH